jgi:hypothetical protein
MVRVTKELLPGSDSTAHAQHLIHPAKESTATRQRLPTLPPRMSRGSQRGLLFFGHLNKITVTVTVTVT